MSILITSEKNVSFADIKVMTDSKKYQQWYNNLIESKIKVNSIHIVQIDMFGKNFGFGHLVVDATTEDGKFIPGITVIRGDSVFMLTILEEQETGIEWFVLTHQPRVPAGDYIYEIPAGMVDENTGAVASVAISELVEEIGEELSPTLEDLVLLDEDSFTSPGLLDEKMKIFSFKKTLPKSIIDGLREKRSGLDEEDITVKLIEESKFMSTVQSGPAKLAYLLYKQQ